EPITVEGFTFTDPSYRLKIIADPSFVSSAPVVSPPSPATAGFAIKNDSVSLQGIDVTAAASLSYGVQASSALAYISSVNVRGGSFLTGTGIAIRDGSVVAYSSVTVPEAVAFGVSGLGCKVAYSSGTSNSSVTKTLFVTGSSHSIIGCYLENPLGIAGYIY
ncbi:MAG: hypothetical protein PHU21_00220, partial [Elusimicrobia bacterium]|nr:hypothetical protein [Elusimicrobiota bacterium]